jgi:PTH1 family peptidyl-tRNA hydrolase
MKFFIGLGNPGLKYSRTKHNVGASVVKALAKDAGIKIDEKIYSSLLGRGVISGEKVALLLPQTYMNLSGHAVGELYRREIKNTEDLIVVCDDINLKLGRIRIRRKGSSGGHKGLESILKTLGRDDFIRVRVGIATEAHKGDITGYVLSAFRRKELKNASHAIGLAAEACRALIEEDAEDAMSRFNAARTGTS